jgi:peptide/nickel transport system permease protein
VKQLGLRTLLVVVALGLIARVWPYDVVADVHPDAGLLPPSGAHWLGTDRLGRDVAMRLFVALGNFVPPGIAAALLAMSLGTVLGTIAGWVGGLPAAIVRLGLDALDAVPRLVLVLFACMIAGAPVAALVTGVAMSGTVARAVEARLSGLQKAELVDALRAHGVPDHRILLVHLLRYNALDDILRTGVTTFGAWLVLEASLSYLGHYGVSEPMPSWGNMIALAFASPPGNAWAGVAPALALSLLVALIHAPERRHE